VTELGDPGKTTVVLVHGFPDTSGVWLPVARLLATDFHVVTYDVRGAGRSDAGTGKSAYALALLVEDMAAVINAGSPDAPVHLVGHDWGSIQSWEAVTSPELAGRFASYTSISGPPLDHAALWARSHRSLRLADLGPALRQALHSWYIALFHLPLLPQLMARGSRTRDLWARALHHGEHVATDEAWPAATFGRDFAQGVDLYRANIGPRLRHPVARHTDTPVQIIVPVKDNYVTPALLNGLESWSPVVWRRRVEAGHWVIRTHPAEVAQWVHEVIMFVNDGVESPGLVAARIRDAGGDA
jgi:pimeloyl-ACP methyl ester carboxylesterase